MQMWTLLVLCDRALLMSSRDVAEVNNKIGGLEGGQRILRSRGNCLNLKRLGRGRVSDVGDPALCA